MRKKTGKPLDAAAINAAWENLFNQNKIFTIDGLKEEGWLSIMEVCSRLNKSRKAAKETMEKNGLEYKKFSVSVDGVIRNTGFFRFKN